MFEQHFGGAPRGGAHHGPAGVHSLMGGLLLVEVVVVVVVVVVE